MVLSGFLDTSSSAVPFAVYFCNRSHPCLYSLALIQICSKFISLPSILHSGAWWKCQMHQHFDVNGGSATKKRSMSLCPQSHSHKSPSCEPQLFDLWLWTSISAVSRLLFFCQTHSRTEHTVCLVCEGLLLLLRGFAQARQQLCVKMTSSLSLSWAMLLSRQHPIFPQKFQTLFACGFINQFTKPRRI